MLLRTALRAIAALRPPPPLQLPTDRGSRPPKTPPETARDPTLTASPPSLGKNHRTLCATQMTKPHDAQPPECPEIILLLFIRESAIW